MISVIVPIYNVEPYLRQCIDSIIHQTYNDLEIILVDDGSTDRSGEIADSYDDPRIKVFHTENRGLSAARNLGIDNAHGEYISFVDADDWIDLDVLEYAITQINSSDILCFNSNSFISETGIYSGYEAMVALLNNKISTAAWGKLYRKHCFDTVRFPEGIVFEDTAIMYIVFQESRKITCVEKSGYHYRLRKNSLSHIRDEQSILDYWLIHHNRYIACKDVVNKMTKIRLLQYCAYAILRAWSWRNSTPKLKSDSTTFSEMSLFAKEHFPISFPLSFHVRVGIFLSKHHNNFSFFLAHMFLLVYQFLKRNHVLNIG